MLPISDTLAFHPAAGPLRELYREGHVAIVQGIGYENSSRSHFRALDIWHTCEPEKVATEGWLAHVIRELDPRGENPLTAVSFGRGLPRALAAPGVRATSVDNLDTYGLLSGIEAEAQRQQDLEVFKRMYTPAVGAGLVADYLRQTGQGVLDGAERLKVAVQRYQSDVQYADNAIARSLRDVARVHTAGLGTRVFYTQHGGYDHHAQELPSHNRLLGELTTALTAFTQDLRAHDAADNVAILVFTEFGRRIKDNGSGTDHGSGGGAFVLGDRRARGPLRRVPLPGPGRLAQRGGPAPHGGLPQRLQHHAGAVDGHRSAPHRRRGVRAAPPLPGVTPNQEDVVVTTSATTTSSTRRQHQRVDQALRPAPGRLPLPHHPGDAPGHHLLHGRRHRRPGAPLRPLPR